MRNTPPPRKTVGSGKRLIRGFVAALIVIVGAVVVMSIIRSSSTPDEEEVPKTAPKKIATHHLSTNSVAIKPVAPKKMTREEELFAKTNGYVKAAGKMLTEDGRVLTFEPPKDGEYRIVHSHGKMYKCDSKGNFEDITPKPIFENSFEECLVGMAMDGGSFLPGMLMGYEQEEVLKMLNKVVVINPDDPEDVVAKKEAVAYLKADALDYIKNGGTFDGYVTEMHEQTKHEKQMKTLAMREMVSLLKKGNDIDAALYCEKANQLFEKNGFRSMRLPKRLNDILNDIRNSNQLQEQE